MTEPLPKPNPLGRQLSVGASPTESDSSIGMVNVAHQSEAPLGQAQRWPYGSMLLERTGASERASVDVLHQFRGVPIGDLIQHAEVDIHEEPIRVGRTGQAIKHSVVMDRRVAQPRGAVASPPNRRWLAWPE